MTDLSGRPAARRVVFVAPNWLGDAVMAAPALTALRRAEASDDRPWRVIWAGRGAWAPLFADDPRIDSLIEIQRPGRHAGPFGAVRLGRRLHRAEPDAILLGPPSLRMGAAAALSGAPLRVGYASDGRGLLLNLPLRPRIRGSMHYTREMLELVSRLAVHWGLPDPAPGAGDPRHPPAFAAGDYLPGTSAWPVREETGPPLWAVSPGTTFGPAKNWPTGHFAEFLVAAVTGRGHRVVLLGDAASAPIVAELADRSGLPTRTRLGGEPGLIDLTGRTGLRELVGVLRGAEAFVGNDSGLMHLAGALGTPTVGIFGSSNPDWTAPAGRYTDFVQARGFACSPCYRPVCTQAEFCLETVRPAEVLARVDQVVAAAAGTGSPT